MKLPPEKHLGALAIVGADLPPRHVIDPASSALFGEMQALLDVEESENFLAAATRRSRSGDTLRIVD